MYKYSTQLHVYSTMCMLFRHSQSVLNAESNMALHIYTHCAGCIKGTLQAKYEFTSVYRTVHADFSSAVRFLIPALVYEILLDMLLLRSSGCGT